MGRLVAFLMIVVLAPLFICIVLAVLIFSGYPVLFRQVRIGQYGKPFTIFKFRTMVNKHSGSTTSVKNEPRITGIGAFLRKWKLDELPELVNILMGDMAFVGPRPDVPGYADKLEGEDREILKLKPGLTGPASLKYLDEEELLAGQEDPVHYNDSVIYPDKVKINRIYKERKSVMHDLKIIVYTLSRKKWNEY
ncbi:MAG: sugar transferase [Bacteroidales bacterium]|nr:sugar transferase [Bacteroidales bacterium]